MKVLGAIFLLVCVLSLFVGCTALVAWALMVAFALCGHPIPFAGGVAIALVAQFVFGLFRRA